MEQPVLKVTDLIGGYSPRRPVLHGLSFDIKPGEMIGMIGLNGAGKSTTIKHILGLMKPHSGQVTIRGVTVEQDAERYRSAFAYVPENPALFDELTVEEHLHLAGMAYDVDRQDYDRRSRILLEQFQMVPKAKAFSAHLSKGMKQKVMIMSALLPEPSLYIIDEPFLGLDPLGIRSLLERLVKVKQGGAAILMSSHILSTVEMYCDRFLIVHQGKLVAQGNLEDIREQVGLRGATLEQLFYTLVAGGDGNGHPA